MENHGNAIDVDELKKIMFDDDQLIRDCFSQFVETSPEVMNMIKDAVESHDPSSLMYSAHKLKGRLKYLAAADAAQLAFELETMGHEGRIDGAEKKFTDLSVEMNRVISFIDSYGR